MNGYGFYNRLLELCLMAEKSKAAPEPAAEEPTAAPVMKLDNLFFIEEPKPCHVAESKCDEKRFRSI